MLFRSVHEVEAQQRLFTVPYWRLESVNEWNGKYCLADTVSDMQDNRFSYALLLIMVWLSINYYATIVVLSYCSKVYIYNI